MRTWAWAVGICDRAIGEVGIGLVGISSTDRTRHSLVECKNGVLVGFGTELDCGGDGRGGAYDRKLF